MLTTSKFAKPVTLTDLRGFDQEGRRVKSASLGGEPETSFEQAFASLAFSYIKDKAPRLLDFMAGFQLVDRNEDNTKAVGVFGFSIGKTWVYAPVFFLNGDLKGHELLYVKNHDMFVPLKENWVNYLLAKKPHVMGEQTPESTRSLGVLQPDVRSYSIPPFYSKYGSASLGEATVGELNKYASQFPEWFRPFLPDLGRATSRNFREKTAHITLPDLMAEQLCFTRMVKDACDAHPALGMYCREFYGDDFIKVALEGIRTKAEEEIKDAPEDKPLDLLDQQERKEQKEEIYNKTGSVALGGAGEFRKRAVADDPVKINVIDDLAITHNDVELTDEQKTKMHRKGYLVRDYRKGEEVSHAFNINLASRNELENPDMSGLYDMLVKPGDFEDMLIINNPITGRGTCDFATVLKPGDKSWTNAHRNTLWTRPQTRGKEDQRKWYDDLSDTGDSLKVGGTYMVVSLGKTGGINGTTPFEVEDSMGEGRFKVRWHDWADRSRPKYLQSPTERGHGHGSRSNFDTIPGNWGRDDDYYGDGNMLYLSDREGVAFKAVGGGVMVPKDHKVVKIKDPHNKDDADGGSCCMERWHSDTDAIEPGDWSDLHLQILQKTAELKIYVNDMECQINNGPMIAKQAALFELIRSYGFREETAVNLVKSAEEAGRLRTRAEFRIKYARGYPMLGPGPSAPAIPEPQYGYDGTAGGYPTQYPQEERQPVPDLSSGLTDQSVYDPRPEFMPDPMAMQAAQQAGQQGQKEVFDTAMIASLLKAVRKDSLVDRYTGDLMKALDRLGRILFLFYWHNDNFTDRYGKADMPELEDTLRNAFEVVGDLLLFLQEKDVNPLPGTDMGQPNVQESGE